MHTTLIIERPLQSYQGIRRVLLVLSFVALTIITTTTTIYAAGRPGGNVSDAVVRAVDIAEPAVVRIITSVGGHLTVTFSPGKSATFPQSSSNTNAYPLLLSGSGTFITAHGDILTADHVVNPPHDQSLDQYLDQTAAPDVAAYMNQNKLSSSPVTASEVQQALDSGQYAPDRRYDPAASEVFLSTSYTGPLSAPDFQSLPSQIHAVVDRIEMESAVNEKDVAIVHVPMNDMPTIQLGDSTNVQQQDELTIIGFPGNGDVSSKPTDLLTSSVNKINVSSIKTTDAGAQVIQVGGNVEHGDSGGPALDNTGAVVGIVSFGLSGANSPGGTSFLQASNSARGLVTSLNLDTTPGTFEKAWTQAFTDYSSNVSGHWHKAQQELQQLSTHYPLFQAVTPYLTYAQNQAKSESLPQVTPTPKPNTQNPLTAYAWTIGGIAILILLVILLFGVVLRRGGKKAPAASAAGISQAPQSPMPAFAPPGSPNQQHYTPPPGPYQQGLTPPRDSNSQGYVPQNNQPAFQDDGMGMAAFGAPASAGTQTPAPPPSLVSGTLRTWPCGHVNRSNARFCSICGEPAPLPPTTRRFEQ